MTHSFHFSQVDLPPDTVVAFYNGVRLPPGWTKFIYINKIILAAFNKALKVDRVTMKTTGRTAPTGFSFTVRTGKTMRWKTKKMMLMAMRWWISSF